jgi:integrase
MPAPATLNVRRVVEHWCDVILPSKQRAAATVEQYRWAAGIIAYDLGRVRLSALSVERVERFFQDLSDEGYSRNSIRIMANVLCQVLDEAVRRGHLMRNVARIAVRPADAAPPAERRALSRDELARTLDAAQGDRLEALWVLAIATGARRGELLGLAWSDVSLSEGTVAIRQALVRAEGGGYELGDTKTKASVRTMTIGPRAVAALRAHQKRQKAEHLAAKRWKDSGLVFTSPIGTALDPANVRKGWEALCKRAEVEAVFHELRHTVGSYAVEDDVPLARVADQLGHANVAMLARTYRHRVSDTIDVSSTTEKLLSPASKRSRKRS